MASGNWWSIRPTWLSSTPAAKKCVCAGCGAATCPAISSTCRSPPGWRGDPIRSATELIHQLLGIQLAKAETLTEWRDRPLTRAQVRYAFDDVRYLLPAWKKVSDRLEQLGRSDWAPEEFPALGGDGHARGSTA